MTEKDLQIQDLKAENEKLKEELEQLKQPKAAVNTERLTIEYDGHYVPKELCTIDRLGGADDCEPCHENCDKDCGECAVQKCFDKLAEYENLEEQGLMLKLPCSFGSTIYKIDKIRSSHWEEEKIVIDDEGEWKVYKKTFHPVFIYDILTDLGKTIFLTEQEAQAALEKMKGE